MRAQLISFRAFLKRKRLPSEKGQTLVEYALVLAILTLLAVGIFTELGDQVIIIFSNINAILDTAQGS